MIDPSWSWILLEVVYDIDKDERPLLEIYERKQYNRKTKRLI